MGNNAERWRPVVSYEDCYEVSTKGRVKSCARTVLRRGKPWYLPERILNLVKANTGYYCVSLHKAGKQRTVNVHLLVLNAFRGPCSEACETRHYNGIRTDNNLENLFWGTRDENEADKKRHGTSGRRKLSPQDVFSVRREYAGGVSSHRVLAEKYGVSKATITHILSGRNWRCL